MVVGETRKIYMNSKNNNNNDNNNDNNNNDDNKLIHRNQHICRYSRKADT